MVRSVIRLSSAVVLLGYLLIWIMAPTDTYWQKWLPSIRKSVDSSYFGNQGLTFLVFLFPILFVAVLGCIYLHLGNTSSKNHNKDDKSNGGKHHLAAWKKPMLVKGPLGIVSGIELGFLTMFVALVVWSLSTYLHNGFAKITPHSAAADGEKLWEAKLETTGFRLGLIGNLCLTFLFFPVARASSVLPLFGLTSEASIKYHIWLGHAVMAFFTAHGFSYILYWIVTHQTSEMVTWSKTDISNLAGELSLLAGLGLWATTFPRIRRKVFELFFYAHHLYILFIIFFVFHVSFSFSCIMLPGFYLFIVDRYLRFLQSRTSVRLASARILPCQTLELNFSKSPSLSYNSTSILFINVPAISKLQWHPFTITSNSNLETENLSVMIKSEGSWSSKLYQMLSSPSLLDRLQVSVEGPYGPASTHFLRHETLVMVSGGSGITPFISIIRELIFASTANKSKIPQVILISSFKNSSDLTMLDLILPISGTPFTTSNLQLKIEAFVTREKEPTLPNNSKLLRAIWFKPHITDEPISAILGPNSWLWLAIIISSSFIIFLIIIGFIIRFYIYPIDHNTGRFFSYPLRSFLNMLVLCLSIAFTASVAVLWNKSKIKKETNIQIRNIEGSTTPSGSPSSFLYNINSERELESLPHQSLVQATNVHYGERPDLKRMLFECKGSSVGVLVCGPKKMRHEVANICSSGLADNLHFESISFSW
ncbi:ferric reduction oxidase 2-like isoform X2 [Euphorbia lathyris]|uniref:ferric reduction oxidase 2-like isoform X2 n=1 Tax=Euphorbia lathyris TaxID=212925 RepID=UPI003313E153